MDLVQRSIACCVLLSLSTTEPPELISQLNYFQFTEMKSRTI